MTEDERDSFELRPMPCPVCGRIPTILEDSADWYCGDKKGHISEQDDEYIHEGEDEDLSPYHPYWKVYCVNEDESVQHIVSTGYVLHRTRESAVEAWNAQVRIWNGDSGKIPAKGLCMSMFNVVSKGYWSVWSEKDPRFNCSGRGYVGGFECPSDAKSAIERKEKELGCEAPDDLHFSYMKD